MENLTNNPNLSVDIGQKILQPLEDASLQSCRLVNSSMKHMVDKPRFWLQKLEKKGLNPQFKSKTLNENPIVKENLLNWRKLIDWVESTELEKNVLLCLIKISIGSKFFIGAKSSSNIFHIRCWRCQSCQTNSWEN